MMNKAELAGWLIKRIGGKITDITHADLSEDALQIVGDDVETYLSVLNDIIREVIIP